MEVIDVDVAKTYCYSVILDVKPRGMSIDVLYDENEGLPESHLYNIVSKVTLMYKKPINKVKTTPFN